MKKKIADNISTRDILIIAIPLILHQLCLQMQIWIDRAMLGHVNSEYFSAIGNVLVPYYAFTSIATAICGGTTILIAQNIGAGRKDRARRYAECSFMGNFLFPFLAFIFFFLFSEYLFKAMGVKSPILEYSISYVRVLSFTLLLLGPVTTASSVLQGIGITKMIMINGVLSNLLNVLLDWLLIFGKFNLPELGIEGAAYATTISNFITAPILLIYVFKSKRIPFKLQIKNVFRPEPKLYKDILRVGVPSGLEYALWNVGNLIVVSFLNRLDMMSAGIYTLIFSIETFPLLLYMGFANAGLTLVGQKTGEKEHSQAIRIGFRCLKFSLMICCVTAIIFWIFNKPILGIFTNDNELIDYSAPFLIFVAFILFPKAVNNVIGLGIRGLGDTKWMLYTQIFGTVLVIVLSYLLIFTANMGLMGIFITLLIDESIRGFVNIFRFWKGREFFSLKPFKET